tara:strand:- start:209 stop:652 length:444 start_codon:yes stop_codon:yes gene_type:complete
MKIDLTDREIELMMMCVGTNIETIKQRHTVEGAVAELIEELFELETDLREALHRQNDGWGDADDPDLLMDPVDFAAKHDIEPDQIVICDAEINAETATSRAADRRALKFSPPGQGAKASTPAPQPKDRSEVQDIDVWEKPANDPVDW